MYKSDLSEIIAAFDVLERRWFSEIDPERRAQLYRAVQDAEVQFAITCGIYGDLVFGNRSLVSISKEKTPNRMRTRRKHQRCIGLPVEGRASMRMEKKRKPRCRIDVVRQRILDWESFRIENEDLPYSEIRRKWRTHPRVGRPVKSRQFNNEELSWSECVNRFSDYYERAELHKWYVGLPRGRTRR